MDQSLNLREKRTVSEMVSTVFNFVKTHYVNLIKTVVVLILPWMLAAGIFLGMFYSRLSNVIGLDASADPSSSELFTNMWTLFPAVILGFIGAIIFQAAISGYMNLSLTHHQSEITLKMIFDIVKKTFLKNLGAFLLFGLACLVVFGVLMGIVIATGSKALIFVVVFILYLAIIYSLIAISLFAMPITVESSTSMQAIKRSFSLVKGNWWRCFGFYILLTIIQSAMSYVVTVPIQLMFFYETLTNPFKPAESDPTAALESLKTMMPISMIVQSFFVILTGIGIGVLYFSLVEEKDEIGLKQRIASMEEGNDSYEK